MTNFERWRLYLRDVESPNIYKDWAFYYMIGAALERRIWWGTPPYAIYPNIYIVYIAEPAVGKSLSGIAAKHIFKSLDYTDITGAEVKIINRGPDTLTLERLVENIHDNAKTIEMTKPNGEKEMYIHSSIAFFASGELGTLLKSNTQDLIRFLVQGWDCEDFEKETRTQKNFYIKNLCVSLFGCGTPDWMANSVDQGLFNEGLSSRVIFLYADASDQSAVTFSYDKFTAEQLAMRDEVAAHVKSLTEIAGQVQISPEVREWCDAWYFKHKNTIYEDKNLKDYYGRKKVHLMKLAMIIHFSESLTDSITIADLETALAILDSAEMKMSYALGGMAVNPIAKLAFEIELHMKRVQVERFEKVVLKFYENAINGDKDVVKAIDYLVSKGAIRKTVIAPYMIMHKDYKNPAIQTPQTIELK